MSSPVQTPDAEFPHAAVPATPPPPPTPLAWRAIIAAAVVALGGVAYLLRDQIGSRGQAACGAFSFFGIAATFSANLRSVNWRTIGWGIALQMLLALLVLKGRVEINGKSY